MLIFSDQVRLWAGAPHGGLLGGRRVAGQTDGIRDGSFLQCHHGEGGRGVSRDFGARPMMMM